MISLKKENDVRGLEDAPLWQSDGHNLKAPLIADGERITRQLTKKQMLAAIRLS